MKLIRKAALLPQPSGNEAQLELIRLSVRTLNAQRTFSPDGIGGWFVKLIETEQSAERLVTLRVIIVFREAATYRRLEVLLNDRKSPPWLLLWPPLL